MKIRMSRSMSGAFNGSQSDIRFFANDKIYDEAKGEISSDLTAIFLREGWAIKVEDAPLIEQKIVEVPERKIVEVPQTKGKGNWKKKR